MSVETIGPVDTPRSGQRLRIDFLYLDLTTCTRCRGTDRSLGAALTSVADVLRAAGVEVEVNKVLVTTEEQARAWRFVISPTIRVNGTDIALKQRESVCGSEACTDGCGDQIACRVWVYRGREYTEPPAELIVDVILRHVYGEPAESVPGRYELPENLRRFFAGRAAAPERPAPQSECCEPAEQQSCCDAGAKQDCCGSGTEPGCGCR